MRVEPFLAGGAEQWAVRHVVLLTDDRLNNYCPEKERLTFTYDFLRRTEGWG